MLKSACWVPTVPPSLRWTQRGAKGPGDANTAPATSRTDLGPATHLSPEAVLRGLPDGPGTGPHRPPFPTLPSTKRPPVPGPSTWRASGRPRSPCHTPAPGAPAPAPASGAAGTRWLLSSSSRSRPGGARSPSAGCAWPLWLPAASPSWPHAETPAPGRAGSTLTRPGSPSGPCSLPGGQGASHPAARAPAHPPATPKAPPHRAAPQPAHATCLPGHPNPFPQGPTAQRCPDYSLRRRLQRSSFSWAWRAHGTSLRQGAGSGPQTALLSTSAVLSHGAPTPDTLASVHVSNHTSTRNQGEGVLSKGLTQTSGRQLKSWGSREGTAMLC